VWEDKYSLHLLHSHKWSSLAPCTRVFQGLLIYSTKLFPELTTVFIRMQDEVFSLKVALKYVR